MQLSDIKSRKATTTTKTTKQGQKKSSMWTEEKCRQLVKLLKENKQKNHQPKTLSTAVLLNNEGGSWH